MEKELDELLGLLKKLSGEGVTPKSLDDIKSMAQNDAVFTIRYFLIDNCDDPVSLSLQRVVATFLNKVCEPIARLEEHKMEDVMQIIKDKMKETSDQINIPLLVEMRSKFMKAVSH